MCQRPRPSILVAIDSPLVELGLCSVLHRMGCVERLAIARSVDDLARMLRESRPDLLLADAELLGALAGAPALVAGTTRVLVLSSRTRLTPELDGFRSRCCGFVPRRIGLEALGRLLDVVTSCTASSRASSLCGTCVAPDSLRDPRLPLSDREQQVFERIGAGEGNQAIAAALGVSVKTIETYRENIKTKLGLDSSYALLRAAIVWRRGEIEPATPRERRQPPRGVPDAGRTPPIRSDPIAE